MNARAVADAILYEGYLLYPYRASAAKNRVRWQWGVLMPPAYDTGGEHADAAAELVIEPGAGAVVRACVRFLHVQERVVHDAEGAPRPSLTVDGVEHTSWEEAVEREVTVEVPLGDHVAAFEIAGEEHAEPLPGGARIVRRTHTLRGEIRTVQRELPGPYGVRRLRIAIANTSAAVPETRARALTHALVAAHAVVTVEPGVVLSSLDPPEWAAGYIAQHRGERLWSVLISADTALCAPIILYDSPSIAEQSAGDLFDGTEIDEILTLRTMTLTDEEKRQARATDPRAAEIIDRADSMPPELLDRLHGTIRYLREVTDSSGRGADSPDVPARPNAPWWDPGADTSVSPSTDSVTVTGVPISRGSRVRLRPGRRADAHDMFLAGREATVEAVLLDVDGNHHVAVSLDEDEFYGRFRYFDPDEVEPL